ncbi:Crp/Fnr family transcriptional regulator [Pedobacter sp. R20-19]|uniref:Crp/Fnr family transcriptional regulator n=1 Tax=Pedobacter sp. R20-19 TaxID=1270196 RepID=UPI00049339A8|nr:Crp/Fnr family transcriptional regulator [Pedobacter sp. R20-19]
MKFYPIFNFFNALEPVSDELIEQVRKHATAITVCKNTRLHPDGSSEKNALFIASGTLRKYTIIDKKQITLSLYGENELIGFTEISQYLDDEGLEAICDSELILLPKDFVEDLYINFPEVEKMVRKIFSLKYQKSVLESRLCRLPSAIHRYSVFSKATDRYNLPARILASYLLMREETFSRLKTKHKKESCL